MTKEKDPGRAALEEHWDSQVRFAVEEHERSEAAKVTKEKDPGVVFGELWDAVMDFAEEMYYKLQEKYVEGYQGWDFIDNMPMIKEKLEEHIHDLLVHDLPQEIDIANFAMMLHRFRKEKEMTDTDREMSLIEWVERLPETHRARRELEELQRDEAAVTEIYGFADGWFGDECSNAEDVKLIWKKSLKQAEETALIVAGVKPQKEEPIPPNCGHGHVFPNPNGTKARCGGPGLCSECSKDFIAVVT